MNTKKLSRRTMLRGLGVSMALPWMESMAVWGQETSANKPSQEVGCACISVVLQ